jgi:AcrR family transcriptional regulator
MSTRDRIMDGAVEVMRTRGLANTTTKEIARAAGLSEAMLYKVFRDKVDLFLGVLTERLPRVAVLSEEPEGRVGRGTVRAELRRLVSELLSFHLESFPIAASVFSDPNLLGRRQELTMTTIDTEDPLAVAVTARSTPATPGPCGGCSRRAPSWRRQGSAMTTPMGCRAPCCMSRRSGLDTTRTARRPTPP